MISYTSHYPLPSLQPDEIKNQKSGTIFPSESRTLPSISGKSPLSICQWKNSAEKLPALPSPPRGARAHGRLAHRHRHESATTRLKHTLTHAPLGREAPLKTATGHSWGFPICPGSLPYDDFFFTSCNFVFISQHVTCWVSVSAVWQWQTCLRSSAECLPTHTPPHTQPCRHYFRISFLSRRPQWLKQGTTLPLVAA